MQILICLSLDEEQLKKVVLLLPVVFSVGNKDNLEPKLDYLQKRLSLDEEQLKKVVLRLPSVFSLGIETTLESHRMRCGMLTENMVLLSRTIPNVI